MVCVRVIPCLDVKDNQVVKGVNFEGLRQMGDPVELATRYNEQGADELCVLDISATNEARKHRLALIEAIASNIFIPLSVGGGIRTIADVEHTLKAGADKVCVNSAALVTPKLVAEASSAFGSPTLVVAVDVKRTERGWTVFSHAGSKNTGRDAVGWCQEVQELGAGEILLTSMDADGTGQGYDTEILAKLHQYLEIPLIASGGGGSVDHMVEAVSKGRADAVLAATIFHSGQMTVQSVKEQMAAQGLSMRV